MRDRIFALLGIEPGEESMVTILLTQSVFLGIFFGAFDISAHSLFLSVFDEKMMARAYVLSGLAGIVLTSLYTWLQTKISFKNFSTANLAVVSALTLLLWAGLLISSSSWIVFLVFIMLGPLNILAALGFWGTAGRLFTLRQGKRLFGLVDSGLIAGIILSCYTIPVVLALNFASHNILAISALAVIVATLIQFLTGRKFSLGTEEKKAESSQGKRSVFSVLKNNRYITVMAVFVALSVMTAFFVMYSFMAVTRQQYPSEEDMARFLGIFTGSMMIFTLLVKILAFSYLIRNYGLRITLIISPILISVLAAVAIIIGLSMGYTPAASGFLIFFLVLALGRLFSKSLKDSIESPSFKVIYQTLDEKIRFEVQSAMDGTVNEIAALTSGLILAAMGMLSFIKLIHFSVALLIILLAWIAIAFYLYSEYRKSIQRALETISPETEKLPLNSVISVKNKYSAELAFRRDYFSLVSGDTKPLESHNNKWYYDNLISHAAETGDVNFIPALKTISGNASLEAALRGRSEELIRIMEQSSSSKAYAKKCARKMLSDTRVPQTAEILRLLRDNSPESKRFALYMIGKFRLSDMLTEVCNCLGDPSLAIDAEAVLVSFGAEAVRELQRYFMAVSGNVSTSTSALRIISKISGPESASLLFSRLWSQSRRLREIAVKGLINNDFKPTTEELDRLHQLISDIAGLMTRYIAARVCLKKNNDTYLLGVLDIEISRWKKFLFDLLSLAYDKSSISKIRENLEKDTVESGNFALEMIDLVIDESIKPKIIALLDTLPDEDRVKNLWHFYPGEIPSYNKLLDDIINRDYNQLGIWTKACTLRSIKAIPDNIIGESVSALIFSPETILQEEAARLLAQSGNMYYESIQSRIPVSVRKKTELIITGGYENENFIFEKVVFLSGIITRVPGEELLTLAENIIYTKDFQTDATCSLDCIVWNLKDEAKKAYISYGGKINSVPAGGSYYILPLSSVEEFNRYFPESTGEILAYIDVNEDLN